MSGIVKWGDPFFSLSPIVKNWDWEKYFDKDFFGSTTFDSLRFISMGLPMVNAFENENDYVIEVLAPKLNKEDLSIEIEDNILHLVPKPQEASVDAESEDRLRKEYQFTYSERKFKLPDNINSKKINAVAENGIITITIPKQEPKTPIRQQISIK